MTKNMTRKGLALGAAFALVASALVSQPAAAANEIVLAPSAGTLTGMISGETFTVQATVGSTIVNTQYDKVKYAIANPSGLTVTTALTATGSTADTDLAASTATAGVVKSTAGPITAQATTLAVSVAAAEEGSVTVTGWIDADGDDVIDAAEFSSAPQVITFTKVANVVANVTIDAVRVGDTTVSASVVLPGINMHQLTVGDFGVNFTKGDGTALMAATTTVTAVTANATTKALETGATATVAAVAANSAVKAQAVYKAAGTPASTDVIGASATLSAVAVNAATIAASPVASTTAKSTGAGTADVLLNSSFAIEALVQNAATPVAAVAGNTVEVTITSATLSATKKLTVNGVTYTSNAALPGASGVAKISAVTDAAGKVAVSFTTEGFAANDTVTASFKTENLTASQVVATSVAATYTAYVTNSSADNFATTDGGTVNVAVAVYDQFGGVPANKYDVRASLTGSTQATTAATTGSNSFAALVGGVATLSITDNGTGNGTNEYDITVQERLAGNAYGTTVVTAVDIDVVITAAANLVVGQVLSTTGTQNATTKVYEVAGPIALSLNDVKNADTRKVLETAPTFTNNQALAGSVKTTSSATVAAVAVPNAAVTISGAGLQFKADTNVFAANSITTYTDASGNWSAAVASNKAGKQTITVTSGGATATITVVFAAAAGNTGAVLTITSPDSVLPGSTLAASVKLVDKYGNPVLSATPATFSFSAVSPGIQVGTNPTATDADGVAKLAYFLGNNDSGSIVLTATYDVDGAGATAAITVTKTITIGASAVSSWTKKIDGDSAKIYAKNIVGAGKVQFFLNGKEIAWVNASSAADSKLRTANGASYLVRTVEFAAGKNVLEVYVDGVRTTRTAYTK